MIKSVQQKSVQHSEVAHMRQLFEKTPHERLKNLHWEKAEGPVGSFCYFLGFSESSSRFFKSNDSVMELKGHLKLESVSGTCCSAHFIDGEQPERILSNLRQAVGAMMNDADSSGIRELTVFWNLSVESDSSVPLDVLLSTFGETLELGSYSAKKLGEEKNFNVNLKVPHAVLKEMPAKVIENALDEGIRRGQSLNYARYLGDLPGNALTPQIFASYAEDRLAEVGHVMITSDKELASQGFGGIIAVAQGSKNRPRLVVFDTETAKPQKTVVIIGKGITFDTGGYSIKGKQHHNEMKYDMCGAANTIAALEILAPQLPKVRLVGLLPLAENMVSEDAQRPGDVYRAYNGKSVEVYNTDAEGRLILADVLSYAANFKPDLIIDIATLTGGATSIAGNLAGVMCTNDETLIPLVRSAGREAGEKFVHLEVIEETAEDLKSDVADYTNMHNKWSSSAPTMYAAAFLKEFVPEKTAWIHLDIANMAWNGRNTTYLRSRGATAFGARTLVNVVKAYCG
jgi:leucyl aminopeptidase